MTVINKLLRVTSHRSTDVLNINQQTINCHFKRNPLDVAATSHLGLWHVINQFGKFLKNTWSLKGN